MSPSFPPLYMTVPEMSFTSSGVPYPLSFTYARLSPLRSITFPSWLAIDVRCVTVTVASAVPAAILSGLTVKPWVADTLMSPVRFAAFTLKVPVLPVPSMSSLLTEVPNSANAGAYAPVAS